MGFTSFIKGIFQKPQRIIAATDPKIIEDARKINEIPVSHGLLNEYPEVIPEKELPYTSIHIETRSKTASEESEPVGRPTMYSEEIVQKLIDAFKIDCTVGEACAYAGIKRSTYYLWSKEHEGFIDRMEKAQEFIFLKAKNVVNKALDKNDGGFALSLLSKRQRERYAEKSHQDVKSRVFLGDAVNAADQPIDSPPQDEDASH